MSPAAASRTFPSSTRVVNTASVLTALPAADVSATRAWYGVAADSPGMTTVTVWWTTGTFNESGAVARPYAVVGPYSTDSPTPAPPAETVAVSDAWCADHGGDRDGLYDGRRQRAGGSLAAVRAAHPDRCRSRWPTATAHLPRSRCREPSHRVNRRSGAARPRYSCGDWPAARSRRNARGRVRWNRPARSRAGPGRCHPCARSAHPRHRETTRRRPYGTGVPGKVACASQKDRAAARQRSAAAQPRRERFAGATKSAGFEPTRR